MCNFSAPAAKGERRHSMPSNFTTNFNLSQWEADDKVLRADFNADNAKIDAALNLSFRRELIMEVTAEEDTPELNLDLSQFDWNTYQIVVLNFVPNNTNGVWVDIQMNDGAFGCGYRMLPDDTTFAHPILSAGTMNAPTLAIMFPLSCRHSEIKAVTFSHNFMLFTGTSLHQFEEIKSIQVKSNGGTQYPIEAGGKVQLLGIR